MKTRFLRVSVPEVPEFIKSNHVIAIQSALLGRLLSFLSRRFGEYRTFHRLVTPRDASDEARVLPIAVCPEIQPRHQRLINKVRSHPPPGEYEFDEQQHVSRSSLRPLERF